MNNVTNRHESTYSFKRNGVKHVVKENIIDGEKGLSFYYSKKLGYNKFYSINVKQTGYDTYFVCIKKYHKSDFRENYDKIDTREVNLVGLMKVVKNNRDLDFINRFLIQKHGNIIQI